jgi:hypothetical protein
MENPERIFGMKSKGYSAGKISGPTESIKEPIGQDPKNPMDRRKT